MGPMVDKQILCTHPGSLPRPNDLIRLMRALADGVSMIAWPSFINKVTLVPEIPAGEAATL